MKIEIAQFNILGVIDSVSKFGFFTDKDYSFSS